MSGVQILDGLDTALDVAHGLEITLDLGSVGRPERAVETREILGHRIEDAAVLFRAGLALLRRATVAEQALEDEPGIVLGRQRRCRRFPRDGIQIRAGIAVLALARQKVQIDAQLERRQNDTLADYPGGNLVGRDTVPYVCTLGALRVHPRKPRGACTCVVSVGAVGSGERSALHEPAEDRHAFAVLLERLQDRRQGHATAYLLRLPVVRAVEIHGHAIRQVDEGEALRRFRLPGQGRHHRVEHRKADRNRRAA